MLTNKPIVLLCWNYNRIDWIETFISLKEDFEFVFLSKFDRSSESQHIPFPVKYWSNYVSAKHVLNDIKPTCVVFMSINHVPEILLNAQCQKHNIVTFILQHGLFYDQQFYRERSLNTEAKSSSSKLKSVIHLLTNAKKLLWTLKFGKSQFAKVTGVKIASYLLDKALKGEVLALERHPFKERMPYKVICYTKKNASVYIERDQIPEADLLAIGNPNLDRFFNGNKQPNSNNDYVLFIDIPLLPVNGKTKGFGFTKKEVIPFYKEVNDFAKGLGKKLYIKLHPYSYGCERLLNDPNIVYVEHVEDLSGLVTGAYACIGFNSTLTLPAVCLRPSLVIEIFKSPFTEFLKQKKITNVYQFQDFNSKSVELSFNEEKIKLMEDLFLFKTDGKATERLKEILTRVVKESN